MSPASTLVFRNARSAARSGASGWTSGKHAPPIPNSKRSEMNAESATEDRPPRGGETRPRRGAVAAQREHVFEAGAVDVAQDLLQALRRLGDAAQVGHRLDPELALDRARDLHRSLARGAARPIGDRDEARVQRSQDADRLVQGLLSLRGRRREELERETGSRRGDDLVDAHGRRMVEANWTTSTAGVSARPAVR